MRLLLDEHYPQWLADLLTADGIDTEAVITREDLQAHGDAVVLRTAARERRVVVTEDVTTFGLAIEAVPDHVGVVFCHHARYPQTRAGLVRLGDALGAFARNAPVGLAGTPFVWWLGS